ncbi:uncharacterized protein [Amphiura filiformis]|uniref:uncharacterized protein n=1 Tax=Amphiura filiformis TaxID=82378 RepID=UPI003B214DB7
MMTNIDIFMFPVYRCKLCPNYYTTVKTTMIEHMKDVHRWSKNKGAGSNVETLNIGGNEGHVGESTQDRVKNIQKIFERKLRSQSSGDGDAESVHSQNSLVEIPFSSGSPPEEVCERVEQNGSVDGGDNNDDDDDDGGGGFEDVDDDDYDVGSGGFEDVDDDNDGDGGETEEIEAELSGKALG